MVSNGLKKIRNKQGMSISELARRANVNRMTITNIENMKTTPNLDTVIAICKVFEMKVDDIFFESCVNHELQKRGGV
ncbi:helix-turn-helix transcriptional regulator [Peribacillus muralis]|uniref:helix-turn-helix transcriptional regulator n=1 Tax=Peribacillus muralis TaxID=264697 RepID=UPI001F4DA32B|nr:helix-turn-helix transcriptional regulator [Peribacillus muralis]MCK1994901.1 helix-turn-helix domain-containing protein [Peribacillus muralis]MCK2015553.1 helix-turn-helix domain-containing protein [Peribacillus muralis]